MLFSVHFYWVFEKINIVLWVFDITRQFKVFKCSTHINTNKLTYTSHADHSSRTTQHTASNHTP